MPEVLVAAAAGLGGSAIASGVTSLIGSQLLGSLVGAIATSAISAGLSSALGLNKKPKAPKFTVEAQDRQQMIRSAVATRSIIYGQSVVSGPIIYATSTGDENKFLHVVIPLAGHEVEEISTVWFGDEEVGDLDANGNVTSGRFSGWMRVRKNLGAPDQLADSVLDSEVTDWTADHRLRGIAYIYLRLKWDKDQKAYPYGLENIKALVKGKKLYDPRTETTAWSDNWALCVRDYVLGDYGLRATLDELDDDNFIAAANLSDELVATPSGGTEKRYTCNGTVDLGNTPMDVLRGMLTAGAGKLIYSQGVYLLFGGQYITPTVTLDEDDLRGPITVRPRVPRQQLFNRVRGTYVDPEKYWQPSDFLPIGNSMYELQDGGEQITTDIELPYTTSSFAAQRLAKITLERARQGITVTMPCKLTAFKVRAGDFIALNIAQLGWVGKVFSVTTWRLSPDGGVDLELKEEASTAYAWSAGEATVVDPAPDTLLPSLIQVPPPSGLILDSGSDQAIIGADGTVIPRIYVQWTASPDGFVANTEIQYKPIAASDYRNGFLAFSTQSAYIEPVQDDTTYDVRIRAINVAGVPSDWVAGTIAATGKDTAPGDPSSLMAVGVVGGIRLVWTNPVDRDLAGAEVWESETNDRSAAVFVDTAAARAYDRLGLTEGVTRYYWIRAVDRTGNVGGWHPSSDTAGVYATAAGVGATIDYEDIGGTKPPTDADNTGGALELGQTITSGGITFNAGGAIKGGQTAFNVGTGWFLGYEGGHYKFSIGNPGGGAYLAWDGSTGTLTVTGRLQGQLIQTQKSSATSNLTITTSWTVLQSVAITTAGTKAVIDVSAYESNGTLRFRIRRDSTVLTTWPVGNLIGSNWVTHRWEDNPPNGAHTYYFEAIQAATTGQIQDRSLRVEDWR